MRVRRCLVDIHELVIEMKLLERRSTLFEEKYGVLRDTRATLNLPTSQITGQ